MKTQFVFMLVSTFAVGSGLGLYSVTDRWSRPALTAPEVAPQVATAREAAPAAVTDLKTPAATRPTAGLIADSLVQLMSGAQTEAPRGGGTIQGKIIDENGAPVAAVIVTATPCNEDEDWESAEPQIQSWSNSLPVINLESALSCYIAKFKSHRDLRMTSVTDARGAFAFTGVPEGSGYTVRLSHTNYNISPTPVTLFPDSDEVFYARRIYRIPCNLLFSDGSSPPVARIEISRIDERGHPRHDAAGAWRPASPWIDLPEGEYSIRAMAGKMFEFNSDRVDLTVNERTGPTNLLFTFETVTGISGTVTSRFNISENRSLEISATQLDLSPPEHGRERSRWRADYRGLGYDGGYFIFGMPSGRYEVTVSADDVRLACLQTVVSNGPTVLNIEVPPLPRDKYLIVRPYGPDNRIIEDVCLETLRFGTNGTYTATTMGRNADGSYWVLHPTGNSDLPGQDRHGLIIKEENGCVSSFEYTRSAESELTVHPGQPARLTVTPKGKLPATTSIVQFELSPLTGCQKSTEHFWQDRSLSYDSDSRTFVSPYVQRGPYELTLTINSVQIWQGPVNLDTKETSLTVEIPPTYTLKVKSDDYREYQDILLWSSTKDASPVLRASLDSRQQVAFHGLPAGEYFLTTGMSLEPENKIIKVSIPAEQEVLLNRQHNNAIRVLGDDEDGYISGTGFRTNDLIVAINAAVFKDFESLEQLSGFESMQRSIASVVRNQSLISIEVNMGKLLRCARSGSVEPTYAEWR